MKTEDFLSPYADVQDSASLVKVKDWMVFQEFNVGDEDEYS